MSMPMHVWTVTAGTWEKITVNRSYSTPVILSAVFLHSLRISVILNSMEQAYLRKHQVVIARKSCTLVVLIGSCKVAASFAVNRNSIS